MAMVTAYVAPKILGGSDQAQTISTSNTKTNGPASVKAYQDLSGHFSFRTMMNNKAVKVLVDTGASQVAINQSTAKRIGLRYKNGYSISVQTANGNTKAKMATIKEIRIGQISVHNVKALVLKDSELSGTLLGMSFLKKLKKFEIKGRTLTLVK